MAVSRSVSVRSTPLVSVGERGAAFGTSLELGGIDKSFAWYAGIAGELAASDGAVARWAYGAALRPLWFGRREASGEKSTITSASRQALSIGVETRAGVITGDDDTRGLFGLLPVVDYTLSFSD
jgi:hypothetical protein